MFKFICKRLTERSTWLGLIAFATACGVEIGGEMSEQIIAAGVALAGLVGILTRDNKDEAAEKPAESAKGEGEQNG